MSFNLLRFGLNLKKNNKLEEVEQDKNEKEIENKSVMFPDCSQLKKQLLILKKKVQLVEKEEISEKLKDKKLQMLLEKIKIAKEALNEKLSLNSPQIEEIDPLCSFIEIQK